MKRLEVYKIQAKNTMMEYVTRMTENTTNTIFQNNCKNNWVVKVKETINYLKVPYRKIQVSDKE